MPGTILRVPVRARHPRPRETHDPELQLELQNRAHLKTNRQLTHSLDHEPGLRRPLFAGFSSRVPLHKAAVGLLDRPSVPTNRRTSAAACSTPRHGAQAPIQDDSRREARERAAPEEVE